MVKHICVLTWNLEVVRSHHSPHSQAWPTSASNRRATNLHINLHTPPLLLIKFLSSSPPVYNPFLHLFLSLTYSLGTHRSSIGWLWRLWIHPLQPPRYSSTMTLTSTTLSHGPRGRGPSVLASTTHLLKKSIWLSASSCSLKEAAAMLPPSSATTLRRPRRQPWRSVTSVVFATKPSRPTRRWADTRPVTGSSPELKINPPPPAPPTPQTPFPRSTPVVKSMSAPSATRLSPQVKLWADTSGATTIPAATAAAQETAQLRGRMVRVGATVTVTLTWIYPHCRVSRPLHALTVEEKVNFPAKRRWRAHCRRSIIQEYRFRAQGKWIGVDFWYLKLMAEFPI